MHSLPLFRREYLLQQITNYIVFWQACQWTLICVRVDQFLLSWVLRKVRLHPGSDKVFFLTSCAVQYLGREVNVRFNGSFRLKILKSKSKACYFIVNFIRVLKMVSFNHKLLIHSLLDLSCTVKFRTVSDMNELICFLQMVISLKSIEARYWFAY